jgi:hypothetical protein
MTGRRLQGGADFCSYVGTDENIITGQNPCSAVETATRLLVWLLRRKSGTEKLFEEYQSIYEFGATAPILKQVALHQGKKV